MSGSRRAGGGRRRHHLIGERVGVRGGATHLTWFRGRECP